MKVEIEGAFYHAIPSKKCHIHGVFCSFQNLGSNSSGQCVKEYTCAPTWPEGDSVVFYDNARYAEYLAARMTS